MNTDARAPIHCLADLAALAGAASLNAWDRAAFLRTIGDNFHLLADQAFAEALAANDSVGGDDVQ